MVWALEGQSMSIRDILNAVPGVEVEDRHRESAYATYLESSHRYPGSKPYPINYPPIEMYAKQLALEEYRQRLRAALREARGERMKTLLAEHNAEIHDGDAELIDLMGAHLAALDREAGLNPSTSTRDTQKLLRYMASTEAYLVEQVATGRHRWRRVIQDQDPTSAS